MYSAIVYLLSVGREDLGTPLVVLIKIRRELPVWRSVLREGAETLPYEFNVWRIFGTSGTPFPTMVRV